MFNVISSKRPHFRGELIPLEQATGVRDHPTIYPWGETVRTCQGYTEIFIYFKWKRVRILYVQLKNSWKGIHLAVRDVISNYNETCYQGLRKKIFFIIKFSRYLKDLQNPSSSNILDLYCRIQTWQKLNRSGSTTPGTPRAVVSPHFCDL